MDHNDILNRLDLVAIKEQFLYANTPAFLFRKLREIPSIQNLLEYFTPNELILYFNDKCGAEEYEFDELMVLYAIIMALSFGQHDQVSTFFQNLNNCKLDWAKELSNIYSERARSTQILTYTILRPEIKKPEAV